MTNTYHHHGPSYMGSRYQTQVLVLAPRKHFPARHSRRTITERCRHFFFFSPEQGRCLFYGPHCALRLDGVKPGGFKQLFSGSSMTSHSPLQAAILSTVCHPGNQPSEYLGFVYVLISVKRLDEQCRSESLVTSVSPHTSPSSQVALP